VFSQRRLSCHRRFGTAYYCHIQLSIFRARSWVVSKKKGLFINLLSLEFGNDTLFRNIGETTKILNAKKQESPRSQLNGGKRLKYRINNKGFNFLVLLSSSVRQGFPDGSTRCALLASINNHGSSLLCSRKCIVRIMSI
jgi:hypothetical protein